MSTATTTAPTGLSPFARLARTEAVLLARDAGAVLWTALLPVVALIVIGAIPAVRHPAESLHGLSYLDAYLPILMMFSVCMAMVNILPPVLAGYREKGILRRLGTTPVPPSRLLAAQALIHLALSVMTSVVMLIVAVAGYSVSLPHQLPGFVVSLALVGAAATGIGLLIAALARSAKAANAISLGLFFPLMFLAGLWVPRPQMPSALRHISDFSPLGAGVQAIQSSIAGDWPDTQALLVPAVYAVVCCVLAIRAFRWE